MSSQTTDETYAGEETFSDDVPDVQQQNESIEVSMKDDMARWILKTSDT